MPNMNRKRKHDYHPDDENEAPKPKFRPYDATAQAEDEQLTKILFGGATTFLKSLEEAEQEDTASCANLDSGIGEDDSDNDNKGRKPAWYDQDDDGIDVGNALESQGRSLPQGGVNERSNKYSNLLKHKFISIVGSPKWALLDKIKKSSDSDSDDEVLQSCGFINKTVRANLAPSVLEYKKVKDLNSETYGEGPFVNTVEFLSTSSVALVAGNNGVATLYAVDGKRNNKLHSVAFEHFPILCSKFIQNDSEAIFGSRHAHIFSYDLMTAKPTRITLPHGLTQFKKFVVSPDQKYIAVAGKWGEVHLFTSRSKERLTILKQTSDVTALSFSPQGNALYGHSDTGEVTIWDMDMRRVKHKFIDEGCLQGNTLAISPSNQFLATGSAQGVVNLYGIEDVSLQKLPKPRKTILNLTMGITDLQFNPTSEMLAFSSSDIPNSVKLFHVNSGTTFKNFPCFETKFGHINTLNFSPGSGYIAFGNKKSTVSLYRLKHYKNY